MVAHHSHFQARGQAQYEFRTDFTPGRHCIFRSGWGGGKTYTGADKGGERAARNERPGIFGGQNYQHLTQVMVPAFMERAAAQGLDPHYRSTDKIVVLRNLPRPNRFGAQYVFCRSGDAPLSIRGVEGTWGWFDEPAAFKRSDSDAMQDAFLQFQGRVRGHDEAPGWDWTGTNEGEGTRFYDLQTSDDPDIDVRVYTGSTMDNVAGVGMAFIRNVEQTLPPELLEQYLRGGVGQLAQEMAAWDWDDAFIKPCAALTDFPLITCWDFGIAPMAMSVAQRLGDHEDAPIRWVGEVVLPVRGNTQDACERFCEMYSWHPGPVIIKGDASGKAGSSQSRHQNYEQIVSIMERYWPGGVLYQVPQANPPILTRLVRANAAMRRGLVSVDPGCANLIRDLRGTKLKQTESGPKEDQRDGYSHSWVGMAYALNDYYPMISRQPLRAGAHGRRVSFREGSPVDPKGMTKPW